jgi:hypothetical protein
MRLARALGEHRAEIPARRVRADHVEPLALEIRVEVRDDVRAPHLAHRGHVGERRGFFVRARAGERRLLDEDLRVAAPQARAHDSAGRVRGEHARGAEARIELWCVEAGQHRARGKRPVQIRPLAVF